MISTRLTVRYSRSTANLTDCCISFRYEKERYTPYTTLSGEWYCPENINLAEITTVMFYVDNKQVHNGYPADIEITKRDGRTVLKLSSKSYSSALTYNQCPDGLLSDVNLTTLVQKAGFTLPGVLYQQNTPVVNYVNYYNGTSLWDGIVSYSLRATGFYPYLQGVNTVAVSPPAAPATLSCTSSDLISRGHLTDLSRPISKVTMRPIDGEGENYTLSNVLASRRNIVRCREIPFDREWIMDPEAGLQHMLDYSMRGINADIFTVYGWQNADILDTLNVTDLGFSGEISKISAQGSEKNGIVTKLWCYQNS